MQRGLVGMDAVKGFSNLKMSINCLMIFQSQLEPEIFQSLHLATVGGIVL